MKEITVKVHDIAAGEVPPVDEHGDLAREFTGRVAFIFDGCVVSGWQMENGEWVGDSDVAIPARFSGVTHWIEFPVPVWKLTD